MKRAGAVDAPRFVRFFGPLLQALKTLGGSASPDEAKGQVVKVCGIKLAELAQTLASGNGRVSNEIDWARFYLAKAGYVDSSKRGCWGLTDRGKSATLTAEQATSVFKKVHRKYGARIRQRLSARKAASVAPRGKVNAMPRKVARRIMARCARGEKKMVVVARHGKPSSVFGFDEYLKMQELPRKVKPWTGRKVRPSPAGELPTVDAGVTMPLKRKDYYE